MKSCLVCGALADVKVLACSACGEASWKLVSGVAAAAPAAELAPKKAAKKASKKSVPAADAVVEAPVDSAMSDAEFAAEVAVASDVDLLSLLGEEALSPVWREILIAEIDKRGAALEERDAT